MDPDVNFYSELTQESSYITDDTFVIKTQKIEGFSLIHFNCRSIKSCFEDLKDYLVSLRRHFEVICISESWLKNDDNINDYMLDNYDMVYRNRTNKRGGGVIIYVSHVLKFKLLSELSENIDDVYECVSVEIATVKSKNITITCLYRPPGTNIELFNYYLELLLGKVNQDKTFFLVGDFNININNSESHSGSNNFIDLLSSLGLHPLVIKPTRISFDSVTLIDNIFTK